MNKERLVAAALDDERLLEVLIPGRSPVTRKVRAQIRSFASNPAARGALIIGPVGAGKSTIARVIALMRYLHWCPDDKRKRIVQHLFFDGPFRIDKISLNWFEEVNLTGLTDELAQAQLFGVVKGAATGVRERRGIFEQAMSGHFAKDDKSEAARITGGVVLLDEIGDFSPSLQPLLLMLLTSAEVFRVGGEGNPNHGYSYKGVTLGATWKDPFDGTLRPDLLSRLANYVIRIPGLNDRRDEFEDILGAMVEDINGTHTDYLDGLDRESAEVVSRVKIKQERVRQLSLNQGSISFLRDQDWSRRGDLRGLRQILERCFYEGLSVSEAAELLVDVEPAKPSDAGQRVRDAIEDICRGVHPSTLTREINRIESQFRARLAGELKSKSELRKRVAARLGINDHDLKRQLNSLTRERSATSSNAVETANSGDNV